MKTISLVVIEREDDSSFIVDASYLAQVNLTLDELKEKYGESVKEHKIVFKKQSFSMKREINKAAQVPDLILGFKLDNDLIPAARASVVVDNWTFDVPVSVEGFGQLDYLMGEVISAEINQYLYPDVAKNPDFFAMWTNKVTSSKEKPLVS